MCKLYQCITFKEKYAIESETKLETCISMKLFG